MRLCVLGLGYVGLPLAVEFAKKMHVIGFDVNEKKLSELRQGHDSMNEVSDGDLEKADMEYTSDPADIKRADFIIVAVPTPVGEDKKPDLSLVESATITVGKNLSKGSIVVYESTVYPGVTEELCLPLLKKHSHLKHPDDFSIGYSPERINPGDHEHTVDKIVKVVAGDSPGSTAKIAEVYRNIITAGVFEAKSIKTAEAAKVIENTQRDLNIALMNELSLIFARMGIDTHDVIEAAGTKWNFHKYSPGLVGGHCIGVDPYYLTFKAKELGYDPKVILAGRNINDNMYKHVVDLVEEGLKECDKSVPGSKILVLGLTFKENINDTRNSKVKDVINLLEKKGAVISAYDPMLSDDQLKDLGVKRADLKAEYDAVVLATGHDELKDFDYKKLGELMPRSPVLVDVRRFYVPEEAKEKGFIYRCL